MKFLVFNLAVAAALVYLLTAKSGDIEQVAGSLHQATNEVKSLAKRSVKMGERRLKNVMSNDTPESATNRKAIAVTPADGQTEPGSIDDAEPNPAAAKPPEAAPATLGASPETAQRRQEVLAGVPASPQIPVLKSGETTMSRADRRKELEALAEEMDLFYVRTLGH